MESNNPTTRINQTFANWCLSSLFLSCLSIGCTHLSAISRLWQFLYISYMLHLAHPLQCKRCQRWSVRYQWISRVGAPQQLESISQYCNILQHIATLLQSSTHIGKKLQNLVQLKGDGNTKRCIAPFDVKVVQRCSCWDAWYGLAELLGSHASSSTLNKFYAHATLRIRIGVSACTGTSWLSVRCVRTTPHVWTHVAVKHNPRAIHANSFRLENMMENHR